MDRIEAIYACKQNLRDEYSTNDLKKMAKNLGISEILNSKILNSEFRNSEFLNSKDLAWIVAYTLINRHFQSARMEPQSPSKNVPVDFGKYTNNLDAINEEFNGIVDKIQQLANEAGIGGREARHFDGEPLITHATKHEITHKSIDEIYASMVNEKFRQAEEEEEMSSYQNLKKSDFKGLSVGGHECMDECHYDSEDRCVCNTLPYRGWTGTYTWDNCDSSKCRKKSSRSLKR